MTLSSLPVAVIARSRKGYYSLGKQSFTSGDRRLPVACQSLSLSFSPTTASLPVLCPCL